MHTHQHLPGQALDNLPGHTIALDFNENTKSRMPPLKSPTSVSNVTKSHSFLSLISALRKSFSGICWEITICVLRCLISNGNSSSLSQLQGAVYILQEQEQARPDPRGQHGPGGIRSEGRPQAKEVLGWSWSCCYCQAGTGTGEYTTVPGFLGVGPGPGLVRVGSGNRGVGGSPGRNSILSTNTRERLGEKEAKCWAVDSGSCFCQKL